MKDSIDVGVIISYDEIIDILQILNVSIDEIYTENEHKFNKMCIVIEYINSLFDETNIFYCEEMNDYILGVKLLVEENTSKSIVKLITKASIFLETKLRELVKNKNEEYYENSFIFINQKIIS